MVLRLVLMNWATLGNMFTLTFALAHHIAVVGVKLNDITLVVIRVRQNSGVPALNNSRKFLHFSAKISCAVCS